MENPTSPIASNPTKAITIGALRFTIELHPPSDGVMNPEVLREGMWEPTETRLFLTFVEGAEVVLDIGANVGWYSMIAGRSLAGTGRVIAFEPEPSIAPILRRNVERNALANVEVVQAAVADREANGSFVTTPDHVGDHHLVAGSAEGEHATQVVVTSVDAQWRRVGGSVDLIKIDTQGAELAIFRGMRDLLAKQARKPVILTEFWPYGLQRFGADAAQLIDLMESARYEAFVIDDRARAVRPIGFDDLRHRTRTDLSPTSRTFIDLLLVPIGDPRRALLRALLQPYGSSEALWRHRIRPTLVWIKRSLKRRMTARA